MATIDSLWKLVIVLSNYRRPSTTYGLATIYAIQRDDRQRDDRHIVSKVWPNGRPIKTANAEGEKNEKLIK